MNSDVLGLLTSMLDNSTLSKLQQAGVGQYILYAARMQLWWYNRINHLFTSSLQLRPGLDWQRAYPSLRLASEALREHPYVNPFQYTYMNVLSTQVLIELGYDPSMNDSQSLRPAIASDNLEVVKVLLADSRVDPSMDGDAVFDLLLEHGETELIKTLLLDPRVDLTTDGKYILIAAAYHGDTEIVKLLLSDVRVDPNEGDEGEENVVTAAIVNNQTQVLVLLLEDKRIDLENYDAELVARRIIQDNDAKSDAARFFLAHIAR